MQPNSDPRLYRDEWNVGFIDQPIADVAEYGIRKPIRWFNSDPWRIFADPFCVTNADQTISLFVENMSHWRGRGEIWQATILPGDDPLRASFQPFMTTPLHLSYPSLIVSQGKRFFTAEANESDGLHLWQQTEERWKLNRTIMNRPAVDPTFFSDGTRWWLFCTFRDDAPNSHLHLFYSDTIDGDDWTAHPQNPVVSSTMARPAGALFRASGKLIRPSQNCSATYGGSLMLNEIVALDPDRYIERPLREITPVDAYYRDGIHTIADAGRFTVIDGKRWHRERATNIARLGVTRIAKLKRRLSKSHFLDAVHFDQPSTW
jgi:hypothetical protein